MEFRQGEMEGGIGSCGIIQMAHVDQSVVVLEVVWPAYFGHFVRVPATSLGNDVAYVECVILIQESPKPLLNPQELLP